MSTAEINVINKIRADYIQKEKQVSKLEQLKTLNKKAKRPAQVFAYVFGSLATLVMGLGMCLVMPEVISGMMTWGIIIGVIGMFLMAINYPTYKGILKLRMKKYSKRIIELSDELLNEQK